MTPGSLHGVRLKPPLVRLVLHLFLLFLSFPFFSCLPCTSFFLFRETKLPWNMGQPIDSFLSSNHSCMLGILSRILEETTQPEEICRLHGCLSLAGYGSDSDILHLQGDYGTPLLDSRRRSKWKLARFTKWNSHQAGICGQVGRTTWTNRMKEVIFWKQLIRCIITKSYHFGTSASAGSPKELATSSSLKRNGKEKGGNTKMQKQIFEKKRQEPKQ